MLLAQSLNVQISQLCQEHGITRTIKPGRGRAKVATRKIQHAPLGRDQMAYLVALHEIGHIVVGMKYPRLEREALAWEWALENSIVEPSYQTRQRICACLVHYLYRAKENGWKHPASDSTFWNLLRWWEHGAQDGVRIGYVGDGDQGGDWGQGPSDLH